MRDPIIAFEHVNVKKKGLILLLIDKKNRTKRSVKKFSSVANSESALRFKGVPLFLYISPQLTRSAGFQRAFFYSATKSLF